MSLISGTISFSKIYNKSYSDIGRQISPLKHDFSFDGCNQPFYLRFSKFRPFSKIPNFLTFPKCAIPLPATCNFEKFYRKTGFIIFIWEKHFIKFFLYTSYKVFNLNIQHKSIHISSSKIPESDQLGKFAIAHRSS